jgi:hypothetical protein
MKSYNGGKRLQHWRIVVRKIYTYLQKWAYRFIRCAELVGDNVAREKYFDVMELSEYALDCPQFCFGSVKPLARSRCWMFGRQLPALANETV